MTWWDSDWGKRKAGTVTNSGGSVSNYQMYFDVDYDSDMNADYSDIRFIDSDDSTQLNYWIEGTTATEATVYVKIPSLPNGSKTIYIYYNNATATTTSSTATLEYYSSGGTLTGWTEYNHGTGDWSIDAGTGNPAPSMKSYADTGSWSTASIKSDGNYNEDIELKIDMNSGLQNPNYLDITFSDVSGATPLFGDAGNNMFGFVARYGDEIIKSKAGGTLTSSTVTVTITGWHTYKIRRISGTVEVIQDDIALATITSNVPSGTLPMFFDQNHPESGGWNSYWDNIKIRKYASPDPTISFAAEESPPTGGSIVQSNIIYKNNQNINWVKLDADYSGTITFYCASDGSTWEQVTPGITHNFTTVGQELKWKGSADTVATINSITIEIGV